MKREYCPICRADERLCGCEPETLAAVREAERRGYVRGLREARAAVYNSMSDAAYDALTHMITEAEGEGK